MGVQPKRDQSIFLSLFNGTYPDYASQLAQVNGPEGFLWKFSAHLVGPHSSSTAASRFELQPSNTDLMEQFYRFPRIACGPIPKGESAWFGKRDRLVLSVLQLLLIGAHSCQKKWISRRSARSCGRLKCPGSNGLRGGRSFGNPNNVGCIEFRRRRSRCSN